MMWFTTAHSAAMLVPVVAFGYTPRQPSFTETSHEMSSANRRWRDEQT
jgi:hypothetical protein